MAVFVITWNLNKERANYNAAREAFIKHLEAFPNTKDNGLESVRWIESDHSASDISAYLRQKLDKNDRLLVSRIRSGEHAGWLNKSVWDWIKSKL
jgi:hypothetical protein